MGYFDTGLYNVQSTLFAWLYGQLIALKPPLISSVRLVIEWDEQLIINNAPMWSVVMLGVDSDQGFQGGNVDGGKHGDMRYGIAQVDCWETRRDDNWVQILAQMQDAVSKAVHTVQGKGSGIVIKDWYTSLQTPANTSYRLTISRIERRQPPVDPNPSIERKRILLYFNWVERV